MTGSLYVISAPSGAGKTSLVHALLQREPRLALSTSHTTRTRRPTEQDGREYHFVSIPEFERMIEARAFLEHAKVFDNYYGTGRAQIDAFRDTGRDVVLEIDWQGARQVRASCPDCHSVFVLPPSRDALRERLQARRTDSADVIERRLRDAVFDMGHYAEFDSVVVNEVFDDAVDDLRRIVAGDGSAYGAGRDSLRPLLAHLLG